MTETSPVLRRLRPDDAPEVHHAFTSNEDMARQGEVKTPEDAAHYVARLLRPGHEP